MLYYTAYQLGTWVTGESAPPVEDAEAHNVPEAERTLWQRVSALVLGGAGAFALRSRRRSVVSGVEAMVGGTAVALEDIAREGWVQAFGERWKARSAAPLAKGARARIVAVDGLALVVEPEDKGERS